MTLAETQPAETEMKPPGIWKTAEGSEVSLADAVAEWADVAYDVLRETAGRYNNYLTYSDLAERVQAKSGIQTRTQTRLWIGKVLGAVAERCVQTDERHLTSLCVKTADQTVAEPYAYVLELTGEAVPEDLQLHAAQARLECYEFYGATIPPRGGKATLTPKVARVREVAAAKRRDETPPVLCATCNVQVPASGHCDECD